MLLYVAVLFAVGSSLSGGECATRDVTLVYPQMAGMTNAQGDVISHLQVESDGGAKILDIKGHPFLVKAAAELISTIRYPAGCADQEINLEFSYRKEYPVGPLDAGTSTRLGPNHFQVFAAEWATDQQGMTGMKLGKRRFWSRLFRPKPRSQE